MARGPGTSDFARGRGRTVASATTTIPGTVAAGSDRARLICAGIGDLVLPWWPAEVENSGLASEWTETPRPGRAPTLTRATEPLPSLRMSFAVTAVTVEESVAGWLTAFRVYAAAKPVVQLMLGASDRGVWRITEAAAVETDWAADGQPSVVDVTLTLRAASDAAIAVGPIRKRPRR